MEKWKTTSSKTLVDDRWLKLRVDSCLTPEGGEVPIYYVLEYGDWANCVVIDTNNELIMIRQYRHGIDNFVSEFVAGGIEKDDPSPKAGIKRELEEEIGYVGGEIYQTGVSYPNPASQTNKVYSFLAVGGSCAKEQQLEVGESITALFFAVNFVKNSSLDSLQEMKKILLR